MKWMKSNQASASHFPLETGSAFGPSFVATADQLAP
jgi:hypothetical protein